MRKQSNSLPKRLVPTGLALALASVACTAAASPAFDFAPVVNIQYDWARFDNDQRAFEDTDDFRRGRLGFKLKGTNKLWQFVAEHDFADKTPADAYLELTPTDGHAIRIGQFKQPFLLEDAVSDKSTPLLEPSLVGVFAISRRIGLEYARFGERGTLNAAVFGQRLDGTSESLGASVRGTWLLPTAADTNAHMGMSLATESPDSARASFSVAPGTSLTPLRLASTGAIAGIDILIAQPWKDCGCALRGPCRQKSLLWPCAVMAQASVAMRRVCWSPGHQAGTHAATSVAWSVRPPPATVPRGNWRCAGAPSTWMTMRPRVGACNTSGWAPPVTSTSMSA